MAVKTLRKIGGKLRRRKPSPEKADVTASLPTPNAATNLLMADVTMRIGSYVLRGLAEKRFLADRYGKETAKQIVRNRSKVQTLASVGVAKFAANSRPGALLVGGTMLGKVLIDASKRRRDERKKGDRKLLETAKGK